MTYVTQPSMNQYRYQFVIGTAEFSAYGIDDRKARRLLSRWLRLVWPKVQANSPRGSLADAVNNGLDRAPEATIYRTRNNSAGVWLSMTGARIESFEVCPEALIEFHRVYGGW